MPFNRPLLIELIDRIGNDIQGKIAGGGSPLRRSITKVLARAFAGTVNSLYGYLFWVSKQLFVTTAEAEQLDRHGTIWGIDRKPATFATGNIRFTGDVGVIIPIGTIVQNDAGVEYETIEQGTISAENQADVQARSVLAGSDANIDEGVILTVQTAITFVDTSVLVLEGGFTGGAFVENDDTYRQRILFRIQNPPQGGSKSDYVIWATSASNVTNAWVFPTQFGAGTVLVTVANYNETPPLVSDLTEVEEIIDFERPVTATVTVLSVVESSINLVVKLLPDNQTTRDSVVSQVEDLLRRRGVPGGRVSANNIREAIGTSPGVEDYDLLEIRQDSVIVPEIVNSVTDISVLNNISFSEL